MITKFCTGLQILKFMDKYFNVNLNPNLTFTTCQCSKNRFSKFSKKLNVTQNCCNVIILKFECYIFSRIVSRQTLKPHMVKRKVLWNNLNFMWLHKVLSKSLRGLWESRYHTKILLFINVSVSTLSFSLTAHRGDIFVRKPFLFLPSKFPSQFLVFLLSPFLPFANSSRGGELSTLEESCYQALITPHTRER